MKKTLLVVATVLLLIVATLYADRATRLKVKTGNPTMRADAPGGDAPSGLEPELTLKDLNGNNVSLSDFKGKVVLVNFWATWCEACRAEVPSLVELQHKYADKGFVILGIALDDEGKKVVAPFVAKERFDVDGRKEPMDYRILIGNDDAAEKFGGLFGYPTSILISKDGKQVKRITGVISPEEMTKTIEAQL
jgi:thiol-disulfide isomerase/thioredoxin